MGQQSPSLTQANQLYEMPLPQYLLKQRINLALSIWKHKSPPYQQLIQSRMVINTTDDLNTVYNIFKMRHMHIYLCPTRYLTCQHQGIKGCGGYFKGNIYLDSTITTLAMINDIPFHDSLHIFAIAIKGFEILFRKFGYFDIFQDMFHICQYGKLKVWCNSQIHKLSPQPYLLDSSGKQDDMIYRIINIIDDNIDKSQPQNLKKSLYHKIKPNTHIHSFQQANIIFRKLCKQNNWQPPERLTCISQLTREQIQKLINYQLQTQQYQYQQSNDHSNRIQINNINQNINSNQKNNNNFKISSFYFNHHQHSKQYQQSTPNTIQNRNNRGNMFDHNGYGVFKKQYVTPHQGLQFNQYTSKPSLSKINSKNGYSNTIVSKQQTPQTNLHLHTDQPRYTQNFKISLTQKNSTNNRQNIIQKQSFQTPILSGVKLVDSPQTYHYTNTPIKTTQYHPMPKPQLRKPTSTKILPPTQIYQPQIYTTIPHPPYHQFSPPIPIQIPIQKSTSFPNKMIPLPNYLPIHHNFNQVSSPQPHHQTNPKTPPIYPSKTQPIINQIHYISSNQKQPIQPHSQSYIKKQKTSILLKDPMKSTSNSTLTIQYSQNDKTTNGKDQTSIDNCYIYQKLLKNNQTNPKNTSINPTLQHLKNNYQQNLQQSTYHNQPQNTQTNLYKSQQNKQQSNIPQQNKQLQTSQQSQKKQNTIYDKLKFHNSFSSDFTDPRLIDTLNQNSTTRVTSTQTSPNNLTQQLHLNPWQGIQPQNRPHLQNQLLYSFSQNMRKQFIKKSQPSLNYSSTQQTGINSQRSGVTWRKYQTTIDQEIWKDLIQLKKFKNLY